MFNGSLVGTHKPFDMFTHDPVEDRDHSPGTKHGQKCADMDPDDAVGKDKGRNSRQDDAGDVNYVLSESEFQTADIRNDLDNAIRGIGNEPHIERHGGSDSYAYNGKNQ